MPESQRRPTKEKTNVTKTKAITSAPTVQVNPKRKYRNITRNTQNSSLGLRKLTL